MQIRWKQGLFTIILIIIGMQCICFSQQSPTNMEKDIEELKKGQQAIRNDLQLIKALLQKTNPVPAEINVRDMQFDIGSTAIRDTGTSGLIMVEFSDYQCPFCGRYARETFPQIMKEYVDSGKIGYAVMDYPLASHKLAPKAAEASHCAQEQGKFWEMHTQLMSRQDSLDNLLLSATSANLNIPQFEACLHGNKYTERVTRNLSLAAKLGITGVPAFVFARKDPSDPQKLKAISVLKGAQPLAAFQKEIAQALQSLPR
jgi:protein-disulfide isomerase